MRFLPGFYDVFDDMFDDGWMRPTTNAMQCDIKEVDNNYEMNIALPGYKKENISLDLTDGYLTVSANTNQDKEEKDSNGKVIRSERYTGSCSRKFYVGEGYKEEDFTAKFDNGELMITFPKTEPKKIEEKKPIMIEQAFEKEARAAKLAATLLKQYNLSVDQLRMHHDWSGKECPRPMIEGQSGSMSWETFKKQVYNYMRTV